MKKRFNTTGVCVHRKHYMVDITNKLNENKEFKEDRLIINNKDIFEVYV